uniref:Glutamyl-tRNA amidotransferase n=1 Tax=Parastrongyloides trichosuri TaxID=131310 RepID=A0A0N4ZMK9_PARTI
MSENKVNLLKKDLCKIAEREVIECRLAIDTLEFEKKKAVEALTPKFLAMLTKNIPEDILNMPFEEFLTNQDDDSIEETKSTDKTFASFEKFLNEIKQGKASKEDIKLYEEIKFHMNKK